MQEEQAIHTNKQTNKQTHTAAAIWYIISNQSAIFSSVSELIILWL